MNISRKEILCDLVVLGVMITLAAFLGACIEDLLHSQYAIWDAAAKVDDDPVQFAEVMKQDGYIFVHGTISAVDPVSLPEISGEYAMIERKEQVKRTGYRRVLVNGKWVTRTRIYWSTQDAQNWYCKGISLLGMIFDYNVIPLPTAEHIETKYVDSRLRYVYAGCRTSYGGTLYAQIKDGALQNCKFYGGKTIDALITLWESGWQLWFHWFSWAVFMGLAIWVIHGIAEENHWNEPVCRSQSWDEKSR